MNLRVFLLLFLLVGLLTNQASCGGEPKESAHSPCRPPAFPLPGMKVVAAPGQSPTAGTIGPLELRNDRFLLRFDGETGLLSVRIAGPHNSTFILQSVGPMSADGRRLRPSSGVIDGDKLVLRYQLKGAVMTVSYEMSPDRISIRTADAIARGARLAGRVTSVGLLAAQVTPDERCLPQREVAGDVLEIGFGLATSRRSNILYSRKDFVGLLFVTPGGESARLLSREGRGYSFAAPLSLDLAPRDLWSLLAARFPDKSRGSWSFDPRADDEIVVPPRRWMAELRSPRFFSSPVHLAPIPMTGDKAMAQGRKQIDFIADKLRDFGFDLYGEYPITQF